MLNHAVYSIGLVEDGVQRVSSQTPEWKIVLASTRSHSELAERQVVSARREVDRRRAGLRICGFDGRAHRDIPRTVIGRSARAHRRDCPWLC